ncbi:hypothetical protein O181_030208 [Austropuccinia psidii MF-1]|uniref:Uncharacterized protein n=1 Tax=Austropuccinia psidii MF-1 TaxID=1389203 RepID=A0A9Q3H3G9_9BASI|nr:hypothetical protein [Austropuccinia psidii MF-1]
MDKILKTIQEGHGKLSKASFEINKRMNKVFERQHHCKRDSYCLDKDLKKFFNVYQNMKPKPQGHVLDTPYHQEDIKPDFLLENKTRSQSQYQDGDKLSYSEKGQLRQLQEASRCTKLSGTEGYDDMELIDYIYGLFIYVPSIQD